MRIGTGYTHIDFANTPKRECVFENPVICIQQGDIWNTDGSVKVLEEAHKRNKPALILADDISGQMLETMLLNANKKKSGDPKGVACCAVRTPGGIEHRELLKDIAAMLNTEIIGPDTGLKINNVPMSIMGTCNKVVIDRESSTFYFTPCERLKNRIAELRAQYEAETDFDRKKSLHGRIAKLTSGMAIIKIGSISDTEKKERFDRADDAVNAVRCALEEGYLPGGGLSYIHASNVLDMDIPGERVLFYALQEITIRILRNAGIDDIFIQKILEDTISENRLWNGYDINSDIMQDYDFKKAGVLDPAKVVRTVVQHASKIAGNLILTSGFISHSID
jgi:chaperonin GroEL